MLTKSKSFLKPVEFHEPAHSMMLRKSASVIEYSPPENALIALQKQASVENPKGDSFEEAKVPGLADRRRQQSSPKETATFVE